MKAVLNVFRHSIRRRSHFAALPVITLALLIGANSINSTGADAARRPSPFAGRADDHLRQKMDSFLTMAAQFGFSGTVHVSRNGEVLLHKAYGWQDRKNRVPMSLDTVLEIGSNTKQFTAAAILFLEQQKKLSVKDPIGRFFSDAPPEKVGITLHQVLTHTAGFPDDTGPDEEPVDRDTVIHRIFKAPLKFQPGTQYSYSNAGYSLLAAVVEKVSGLGYEEFLTRNFFAPVKLRDTGYVRPQWSHRRLATGYSADEDFDNPIVQQKFSPAGPYWNLLGNGGLLSTTEDLFRWQESIWKHTLLHEDEITKMLTPNLRDYGYGWSIVTRGNSRTIIHSGGNDIGFHSVIGWRDDPQYRDSVIVLSNSGEMPGVGAYAQFIARHLYGILSSDEQTNYSAIALTAPKIGSSLVGVYRLADGSRFELRQSHGEWVLFPFGQSAVNIFSLRSGSNDAVYVEANKSTQRLLDALAHGECSKVKDLWPNPDTAETSCARLAAALEQLKKSNGNEPVHFEIVGSVLDWWSQSATTVTFVRTSGAMGERIFRIHWLDGKYWGLGGQAIASPAAMTLRGSPDGYFGWQIAIGKSVIVRFGKDPSSNKTFLEILDGNQRFRAFQEPR